MSARYPDWNVDGADWPNRTASSFVNAGGSRFHVQHMGPAKRKKTPICLLIHGTGAATHSWRDLLPLLAQDFDVIAMDLPGHGFTRTPMGQPMALDGMAGALKLLLDEMGATPDLIVGHSAGVAIAARMMVDQGWAIPLIGFAPALMPFPGLAAKIFPQLAKMLFINPFASTIFSRIARVSGEAEKFLARSTGSKIDTAGAKYYTRLFSRSGHCDGAIRMMANWQLEGLRDDLGKLAAPVLLVHPKRDTAIPENAVRQAASLIPNCRVDLWPALGHLAHEENPEKAAATIRGFWDA
jgi:magnesium chelatase accessory protein